MSSEFDPISQTAELKLENTSTQNLSDNFKIIITLRHSNGNQEQLLESNDYSVKESNNKISFNFKVNISMFDEVIDIHFNLKSVSSCNRETSTNSLQHSISPITLLTSTQTLAALADSSAGVISFGAMAGSLLLFGLNPTAAGILCKALVHSYWLMLIGGPRLVYPDLIFRALESKSRYLLLSITFGSTGTPNKKFEDCRVPKRYRQMGVTCKLIESTFSGVLLTIALLSATTLITFISYKMKRPADKKGDKNTRENAPKSILGRLASLLERVAGIKLFVSLLLGNSMKIMVQSSTVLLSSSSRSSRAFGKFSAFFLLSIYSCLAFFLLIFVREKRPCVQFAIRAKKKPGKRSQNKKLEATLAAEDRGMVQFLAFIYEDSMLPKLQSSMYEPFIDILRCFCMPLAVYLTASHEATQMSVCIFLQLLYTLTTFRWRSLHSRSAFCFQAMGTWLETFFCILKVVSLMDITEQTKQQVIGPAAAIILICQILRHLTHFTYRLALSVFEEIRSKKRKVDSKSKVTAQETLCNPINPVGCKTQKMNSPTLSKRNSISIKRNLALVSKNSSKLPLGSPPFNKRLLVSAANSPAKAHSRIRQEKVICTQGIDKYINTGKIQAKNNMQYDSPLVKFNKLSDHFNRHLNRKHEAQDTDSQMEQSTFKNGILKLINNSLSQLCKKQNDIVNHEENKPAEFSEIPPSDNGKPPAPYYDNSDLPLLTAQSHFERLLNSSRTGSPKKKSQHAQIPATNFKIENKNESNNLKVGNLTKSPSPTKTLQFEFKTITVVMPVERLDKSL
jgi:hypothetical protein